MRAPSQSRPLGHHGYRLDDLQCHLTLHLVHVLDDRFAVRVLIVAHDYALAYSTSICIWQWSLRPKPLTSFMARTWTLSWNPREANT